MDNVFLCRSFDSQNNPSHFTVRGRKDGNVLVGMIVWCERVTVWSGQDGDQDLDVGNCIEIDCDEQIEVKTSTFVEVIGF